MGCKKLSYYESNTALSENWKIFASGIEKTASSSIFCKDYYAFGMLSRSYSDGGYRFGFNGKEQDNEIIGEGRWQDYGARMYRPDLGRFFSPDPLIVFQKKYPELSSYQFASNTPIWGLDWDGKEVRIYTETTGLTGHTFLSVGSGDDIIVYSYGRYDDIGKPSMGQLSPTGEGVLVRLTGQDAKDFINKYVKDYGAKVYELTDIDKKGEEKVKNFFDAKFNSSDKLPDNSKRKYYQNPNARVIDEYNLLNNNCTTISCEAAEVGGTNVFYDYHYVLPLNPKAYDALTPPEVEKTYIEKKEIISPAGLQQYLDYKSKQEGSPVKNVTEYIKTGG